MLKELCRNIRNIRIVLIFALTVVFMLSFQELYAFKQEVTIGAGQGGSPSDGYFLTLRDGLYYMKYVSGATKPISNRPFNDMYDYEAFGYSPRHVIYYRIGDGPAMLTPAGWRTSGYETVEEAEAAGRLVPPVSFTIRNGTPFCMWYCDDPVSDNIGSMTFLIYSNNVDIIGYRLCGQAVSEEEEESPENLLGFVVDGEADENGIVSIADESSLVKLVLKEITTDDETGTARLDVNGEEYESFNLLKKEDGVFKKVASTLSTDLANPSGELENILESDVTFYVQPLKEGIITATFSWGEASDKVKIKVGGCSACARGSCAPGSSASTVNKDGSVTTSFSLGSSNEASYNGDISFTVPSSPSGMLATPSKLLATVDTSKGNEVVKTTEGVVKQIKTVNDLVNIEIINDYKYTISYYKISDTGAKDANGYYTINSGAAAYRVITVEDPDESSTTEHLVITNTSVLDGKTSTEVNEMIWDATNSVWMNVTSNGELYSYVIQGTADSNGIRTSYEISKDKNDNVLSNRRIKYQFFTWGEEIIEETVDPDGRALTSTREYYTDAVNDGAAYSMLKSQTSPDGSWGRYEYDSQKRITKTITPFVNSLITDAESACRVSETVYDDTNKTQCNITRVLGTEVSRTYTVAPSPYESRRIVCSTPGAAIDAQGNQVSITYSYDTGTFKGRTKKIQNADGTLSVYEYSMTDGILTSTVKSGVAAGEDFTDGTRTVTVTGTRGNTVSSSTYDIASGLLISSSTNTCDDYGRVTRTDYQDASYTTAVYGCCGPEKTSDKAGTETLYGYDDAQRLSYTTTDGVSTFYTYDALGRTIATTTKSSSGSEITNTTTYNIAGETVSETNALGNTTTYSTVYTDGNTISTTTYPDGSTAIQKSYRDGSPSEISGTAVHAQKFEYGVESGELFNKNIIVGDNGSETQWTKNYSNFLGKQYKTAYPDASTITLYFDDCGREIKRVGQTGITFLTAYDARSRVSARAVDMNRNGTIDYAGTDLVTKYEYSVVSDNGKVSYKTVEKGCINDGAATETLMRETCSSADGLYNSETAFGRTASQTVVYNGSGGITISTVNPDSSTVVQNYQNGKLLTLVHSVLGTTTYTYDGFNRQTGQSSTVNGSSRSITQTLNALGQVTGMTDAAGRSTTFTYDVMGRRTQAVLPGGRTVNYSYLAPGELQRQYGSDIYPQAFTYDTPGRMKTLTTYKNFTATGSPSGETTTWAYSADRGFMTGKTYPNSSSVNYTYNTDASLATRVWSRGITTTYTYDNAGALSGISYSDGTTASLSYTRNRMGLPVTITDATGTHTFTYNSDGTLASDGAVGYTYDTLGRRSTMVYGANTTSYTYDGMSRLATVSDGVRSTSYTRVSGVNMLSSINMNSVVTVNKSYDVLDRLTNVSSSAGGSSYSYNYTYNDGDKRTKCTLADGSYWMYEYDDLGQVTKGQKFTSSGAAVSGQNFGYDYDTIGNLKTETRNGNVYNYTSNNVNQYTQRTFPGVAKISGRANADATVYIQKGSERPMKVALTNGEFSREFKFDNSTAPVSQLFKIYAVKPGTTDLVKMKEQTVNIPQSPAALTYDADGNLLSDGITFYTWDGENRLLKSERTGQDKVEFTYDFTSRRATKTIYIWSGGAWNLLSTIKFVHDGWNLIAELNASDNSTLRSYTWGEDLSGTLQGAGGVGGLLYANDSSGTYYPVYDGNGNIMVYVNSSGTKVAEYAYSPFGNLISLSGTKVNDFMFRFSTKYFDKETGFYYYGFRYYSPKLGRWTSRDPIEEQGGNNLYAFVSNDAINKLDYIGNYSLYFRDKDEYGENNSLNWTESEKKYVKKIITRVGSLLPASIQKVKNWSKEVEREIKTINGSPDKMRQINSLKKIVSAYLVTVQLLYDMQSQINGSSPLYIHKKCESSDICAYVIFRNSQIPIINLIAPDLYIIATGKNNFFHVSSRKALTTIAHELSHLSGTHDELTVNQNTSAYNIADFIINNNAFSVLVRDELYVPTLDEYKSNMKKTFSGNKQYQDDKFLEELYKEVYH